MPIREEPETKSARPGPDDSGNSPWLVAAQELWKATPVLPFKPVTIDDKTAVQQTLRNLTDTSWFVKWDKTYNNGLQVTPEFDGAYTVRLWPGADMYYSVGADGKTVTFEDKSADNPNPQLSFKQKGTASVGKNGELILDMGPLKEAGLTAKQIIIARDGSVTEIDTDEQGIERRDRPANEPWEKYSYTIKEGNEGMEYTALTLHNPKPGMTERAIDGSRIVFGTNSLRVERKDDARADGSRKSWTLDADQNISLHRNGSDYPIYHNKAGLELGLENVIYPDDPDHCLGSVGAPKGDPLKELKLELPKYKDANLEVHGQYSKDEKKFLRVVITYSRKQKAS